MRYAITREVSTTISQCELTHLEREPIDVERARAQHATYRNVLCEAGWSVIELPAQEEWPDSVFVEDTAVVTDEIAIITRPGAPSRRPEAAAMAEVLGRFRSIERIEAPATIDGGDVLQIGRRVWVGLTSRTNEAGVEALRRILVRYGYEVRGVQVGGCLHLKSAATAIGPTGVLFNPTWIRPATFNGLEIVEIDPDEPLAANVLWLDDVTVTSQAHPRTRERLEQHGVACRTIDVSELAKAEAGLTCCSVLFEE
ncbi:MAG: dimethylargininase [Phycisphaerae bacterium]|nr:dimethylargininase [Phycisphaerae bacterium]